MNIITVKINGMEYNLKGEENQEYLLSVASYVDRIIDSIMKKNSKLNTSSAATLGAVRITDEYFKLIEQHNVALDEIEKLNLQVESESEINIALNKQVERVQGYNNELIKKIDSMGDEEHVLDLEKEMIRLKDEILMLESTSKKYIKENGELKAKLKEMEMQLSTSKYKAFKLKDKVIELENEMIEKGIEIAKEAKEKEIMGVKKK